MCVRVQPFVHPVTPQLKADMCVCVDWSSALQERLVKRLVECATSPQALQSPQQACGALVLLAECQGLVQTTVTNNISAPEFVQAMVGVIDALPAHENRTEGDVHITAVDVDLPTTPVGPDDAKPFDAASDFITVGNSIALKALLTEHPHLTRLSDEVTWRARACNA